MAAGTTQQYLIGAGGNVKSVPMEKLPDSAWDWYTSHVSREGVNVETCFVRVPWLNRGVDLRASALASLPFRIVDGSGEVVDSSDDYKNVTGCMPNPTKLLYLIEASLTVFGKAYLFNLRNETRSLDLRYLLPTSIKEKLDPVSGLTGFTRRVGAETRDLEIEDIIYFWRPDPYVELGPGASSPAMAALSAAGVLYNVDRFAESYFERGAIKVTLLTVKGVHDKGERERIKTWWQKVFRGISRAWATDIVQAETIAPVVIGEGMKELSETTLTKEKREDIATALGIPMTLMWSTEAGGLGGGGVVTQDDKNFYDKTIVPESVHISGTLTEQVFEPMGLRFVFRPETLDVFQADETERAQSFAMYVGAGIKRSIAAKMLGLELPEGTEPEDLDDESTAKPDEDEDEDEGGEESVEPTERASDAEREAMLADLRRWKRKAEKKGGSVEFRSEHIPPSVHRRVSERLATAKTIDEIRRAFSLGMPVASAPETKAHDPVLRSMICPLCGNAEVDEYADHGGLCVCRGCGQTFDPEVEL